MRPSQKPNRARGRGNRKPNGNIVNRVFESAGPEGKVRGTPQQIIDKYLTLARDAQTSGDRVMSENFLQHAEHYQRILLEAQGPRDDQRDDQRDDKRDDQRQEHGDADGDGRDDSGRDSSGRDDSGADEAEEAYASRRREPRPRRDERRDDRSSGADDARQGGEQRHDTEVSGLTTIDSGAEDGESLLVEADEISASQPPRRRRNQRRDRAQSSQQPEADAQGE